MNALGLAPFCASRWIQTRARNCRPRRRATIAAANDVDWPALSRRVLEGTFGLRQNPLTTQIEPHDGLAELFELTNWKVWIILLMSDVKLD